MIHSRTIKILIFLLLFLLLRTSTFTVLTDTGLGGSWVSFTFQVLDSNGNPIRNVKVILAIANETHNFFIAKTPIPLILNDTGWLTTPEGTLPRIWYPRGAEIQPATYNLSLILVEEIGNHIFYRILYEAKNLAWENLIRLNRTSIVSEMKSITFQVLTAYGQAFTGGRLDGVKVKILEIVNGNEVHIWESNVNENAYTKPFNFTIRKAVEVNVRYWTHGKAGYLNYKATNDTLFKIQVWWHDIKIYENIHSALNLTITTDPTSIIPLITNGETESRETQKDIEQQSLTETKATYEETEKYSLNLIVELSKSQTNPMYKLLRIPKRIRLLI